MILAITLANAESVPTISLSRKALYFKALFLNPLKLSDKQ